jgi:hypothetical protein
MTDVTINGNEYRLEKLDAVKQFHVARRLAPVLMALGGAAGAVLSGGSLTDSDILAKLGPLAEVLAQMSDADSEYVLNVCLVAAKRKTPGGYSIIRIPSGAFMFDDIDMPVMLQLVFAVLRENLGNFILAPSITTPPTA